MYVCVNFKEGNLHLVHTDTYTRMPMHASLRVYLRSNMGDYAYKNML